MEQVASFKRKTATRLILRGLLRTSTAYFAFSLGFLIQGSKDGSLPFLIIGVIFFIPSVLVVLTAPATLMNIYCGKYWSTQALFFGIEGIPLKIGELSAASSASTMAA